MAFDAGAIVGRLTLDKSQFDRSADQASGKLKNLSQDLLTTGRQLGRLGSQFVMFGGVALAPFTLMVKSASKENILLEQKLNALTSSFQKLRDEIVVYIVPHLDRLNQITKEAAIRFDNLSPKVKKGTIDFIVYGSVLLIATGTALKFVQLLTLIAGPILKVSQAMAVAIPIMGVFNTFKFGGLATDVGILAANAGKLYPVLVLVATAWASWNVGKWISDITGLNEALSGEKGLFTKMWLWLDKKDIVGKMKKFAQAMALITIGPAAQVLFSPKIDTGAVDIGVIEIQKVVTWVDVMKAKFDDFWTGFTVGLGKSLDALANWGAFGKQVATDLVDKMKQVTSDFFYNIFTGQIKSAMDVFAEFGRFVLKVLADIIAQFIVMRVVMGVFGLGASAALSANPGTSFVSNSAASLNPGLGFAEGIERVPYTGLYKLHTDEQVVPRYDAAKDRSQPITIYNMLTSEAIAMAMSGKEGEGVIVNVINGNSLRNGVIRREVVKR